MNAPVEGAQQAIAAINARALRIREAVKLAITRATFDLVAYVKSQKLSDQVLRVRTGRLRRSITGRVEEERGNPVGLVGTNVNYGRVHELGFKGNVRVREHIRNIKGNTIKVRAHDRKLDVKPRPFLGPSLNERLPTYKNWIADAAKGAAQSGPRP